MNKVDPTPDRARARALNVLTEAMDAADIELYDAERAGNRTSRIALLLERARLWRQYGELLEAAGREAWTAYGCARRDHAEALKLQAEIEASG